LYRLTWKQRVTPSGRVICARRASAARTSVSGYILRGWPTTTTRDWKDGSNPDVNVALNALLGREVWMAGWPSPTVGNATGSQQAKDASPTGRRPDGSKATVALPAVAQLSGWNTSCQQDGPNGGPGQGVDRLPGQAPLAGWSTPTSPVNTNGHQAGNNRFVTTTTQPFKDQQFCIRGKLDLSTMSIGCSVEILPETLAGGPLDPDHSSWLMALPPEWASCAPTAMPSTRKPRRNSSER
jgi:hypothetical protein